MKHQKSLFGICLLLSCGLLQAYPQLKDQCPAKVPLSNIVYPWPHHQWPEVHVYWQYDMKVQIFQINENENKTSFEGLQEIRVRVDGINQKSRQDVYMKEYDEWELKHVVMADYKHSTIMEMQQEQDGTLGECEITRFS